MIGPDDLKADLRKVLAKNQDMGRIIEADDRLKAALAEIYRFLEALTTAFESRDSLDRR